MFSFVEIPAWRIGPRFEGKLFAMRGQFAAVLASQISKVTEVEHMKIWSTHSTGPDMPWH